MQHQTGNLSRERFTNNLDKEQKQPETEIKRYGDCRGKTTVGFESANWNLAIKNKRIRSNRYEKGDLQRQVSWGVNLSHFKSYGTGIYLFFYFLKQVSLMFAVMSIISFLPMIYNGVLGSNYSNINGNLQVYLGRISVGNINSNISSNFSQNIRQSIKNKLIVVIPDMIYSLIFFVFYLYWSKKSVSITKEVKQNIKLMSYLTVELIDFPQNSSEQQIAKFMRKFGSIKEIAKVKNYSEMIKLSGEIYELQLQIKQIRLSQIMGEDQERRINKKIQQIEQLKIKLHEQQKKTSNEIIKYYVVYQTIEQREETIQLFENLQKGWCKIKLCGHTPAQEICLKGYPCKIRRCETQPGGILWENVHITWKSRWLRFLIQTIILILILTISFLVILFLNSLTPPLNNSNIDTSVYTASDIQNSNDALIVQSWCLKNKSVSKSQALAEKCDVFIKRYYIKSFLIVAISVSIMLTKFLVQWIVVKLAKFQRYKSHTEQSKDMMTNLFITYVCTTVLIMVLMQANIFGVSCKGLLSFFLPKESNINNNLNLIVEYPDFTSKWYLDIGYQIWLTWLILAFSPHCMSPILQLISQKLGEYRGRKQVLQKNMQKMIQSEEFQIEDNYATIMMIIFVGIGFSGGMPVLIPLSFLALATRYILLKYSFLRFCKIPRTLDESLNNRAIHILPFSLFFHFSISIWVYGVNQIFTKQQNWMSQLLQSEKASFLRGIVILLERISNTWYLSIMFGICIIVTILKAFIIDHLVKCCSNPLKYQLKKHSDGQLPLSERCITDSYKLENNPQYFPILAIMNPKTAVKIQI